MRRRGLELVLIVSAVALLAWLGQRPRGPLTIHGVCVGMTARQVEDERARRKERAWVDWGADDRVAQAEGNSLERGGRVLLEGHASVDAVRAALGKGDSERLREMNEPEGKQTTAVLLYKKERLEVEVRADGELGFKLF